MASERPKEAPRVASYGRGGAGNISADDPTTRPTPSDLVTPTLKSDLYTTGRGGTGNMARNDPKHPELARAAQDVEAPAHREPGPGLQHFGRGGAANVVTSGAGSPEEKIVKTKSNEKEGEGRKSEEKGPVDKAKGLLQKLGGKK